MTQKIQVEILKPKLKHRWNTAEKGNNKLEDRSEENRLKNDNDVKERNESKA